MSSSDQPLAYRFSHLPPELRNLIYIYTFMDEIVNVDSWCVSVILDCFDRRYWKHRKHHPLDPVTISKGFYQEALYTYLTTCVFQLPRLALRSCLKRMPLMRFVRRATIQMERSNPNKCG